MAAPRKVVQAVRPAWRVALSKWAYNMSYFNQLGLMRDDCLNETPQVSEALRRLPRNVMDERQFRITRALNLSAKKITLPKEQWTKYEDDVHYLQPYLEEVERESKEKAEWNKQ
ncbi:unnamed protein product [Owenia fusiformis]|uniref:Cytochrome b-c1 complex subunit 7 n=1 Tax=Owenia fusiformis TaxID=6347 RepID=A0A8J1U9J6_OWEFU|nr:unnamed protein product [Owenia fusiformis]